MNHPTSPSHRVYLVDLEEPLIGMLRVLADHCDEGRVYSAQDILMMAINLLTLQHNTSEAEEAMMIEVHVFCSYKYTSHNHEHSLARKCINQAVQRFIQEMHRQFSQYGFYDQNGFLKYTFGGWHGEYTPVFVPYTHIHQHPNAISGVVRSEPLSRHPGKIFHPFPPPKPDPIIPW